MSFLLTMNNTQVRIGALKHLANFLSLLSEETRVAYLPRLEEFLKMDNERNWRWVLHVPSEQWSKIFMFTVWDIYYNILRFRLELTEQLGGLLSMSLYTAAHVREYLAPMATQLVQDKVAAVRVAATHVLSNMLSKLHR